MEQKKNDTKLLVSPSLAIANAASAGRVNLRRHLTGSSSTQIVADNFSSTISNLKAPKQEPAEQSINNHFVSDPISNLKHPMEKDAIQNPYELCPLPDLLSLEHPLPNPIVAPPPSILSSDLFSVIESSSKRFQSMPTPQDPNSPLFGIPIIKSNGLTPSSEMARRRRSKISERINILESLMPWKSKMTRGTLLEEAHKYIKFLEAQVTALQTMPVQSERFGLTGLDRIKFGGLEMVNRQQMLQVMVNSAMVQDLMYKKGCCVFSEEQVASLREKMGAGRGQVMSMGTSSSAASNRN